MRPVKVNYSKLVSLAQYSNERYEVEVIVEDGDHVQEAIKTARGIVEIAIEVRKQEEEERARAEEEAKRERKLEWARDVMANVKGRGMWDVREASELLGVPNPYDAVPAEEIPF